MVSQPSTQIAASLLTRFQTVRGATIAFIAPLTPEDMMVQSCAEASPVKWHIAHTSWFFETFVLSEFLPGYRAFNPDFRWLFNSYYKALGEMPEKKLRASFSRPSLDEIFAYRRHVDAAIGRLLTGTPADEALRRMALGLEHEQQHLELAATDIKHAFFTNPLQPAYRPLTATATATEAEAATKTERGAAGLSIAPPPDWLPYFPGEPDRPGLAEIGITPDAEAIEAFAFDNETPRHLVYIAPFRLSSRLSTCAEYLAFIKEDGYNRPELWLSEGWSTAETEGWKAPLYWRRDPSAPAGWSVYTLNGWRSLEELSETPVCHLSFFEADAFARWSGCRLPTEPEWEYVAAGQPVVGNFLESGRLHPGIAVTESGGEPAPGPLAIFGDVWEWTASPYTGYPGYRALPGALGEYNGKFMSSQMILRGGSCVTPAGAVRATYRNFFGPSVRWQCSGVRLAGDGV